MKLFKVYFVLIFFMFFGLAFSFAQDEPLPAPAATEPEISVLELQWVWAEVVSTDEANKAIVAKYLNYETEKEEEIVLKVDENTAYENIQSFSEIAPQDVLSIDYAVSSEGNNIAKSISLEKPKELSSSVQEPEIEDRSVPQAPSLTTPVEVKEVVKE